MSLTNFSQVATLFGAAIVLHAILWARNARFLWSQRGVIARVVVIALVWMAMTDPIGGAWRAWLIEPQLVVGIYLFRYMPIEDLFGIAVVSSAAACAVLVFGYGPRKWVW